MSDGFSRTRRVVVNGARLAYFEQGSGVPVVLVHGGVSDLRTWNGQVSALSQHHQLLVYSRRYARPNAEIPDGADDPVQVHVDDLIALIEARRLENVHLVGHSFGGLITLMLAIQRPDLVRKLVLLEPPCVRLLAGVPPTVPQIMHLLATRPRTAVALIRFGRKVMKPAEQAFRRGDDKAAVSALGQGVLGKTYFQTLPPTRYQQVWENRKPDRAQLLGAGFPPLAVADVASVTAPVLLMRGGDSPPLFHHLTARLAEVLPKARIADIANASHIMHEDKPSFVNAEILKFLDGPMR